MIFNGGGNKDSSTLPLYTSAHSHKPNAPYQTSPSISFIKNMYHLLRNFLSCRLTSWRTLSIYCIASFILFLIFSVYFLPSFSSISQPALSSSLGNALPQFEKEAMERMKQLEERLEEQRALYRRNNAKLQELIALIRRQATGGAGKDVSNIAERLEQLDISLNVPSPSEEEMKKLLPKMLQVDPIEFQVNQVQVGRVPANETVAKMRDTVKAMMKFAWDGYAKYAWGGNEVRPISKRDHNNMIFGTVPLGATLVDGLDTLFIMGLMDEYNAAREWIDKQLNFNVASEVSVFEFNIRYLGSFLTLYTFTGDAMYLRKASSLADALLPAFNTPTGLPLALVNLQTGASRNYQWASSSSILSEFGTLHMEFAYLSELTGNQTYLKKVQRIRELLATTPARPHGLYPNYLNPRTNQWGQMFTSLAGMGDSFYEYLLKEWVRTGGGDKEARTMYEDTMRSMEKWMFKRSPTSNFFYVGDYKYGRVENKMDHLACFAGGMFSLAAETRADNGSEVEKEYRKRWHQYAVDITHTCRESYTRTATQLGPESFHFAMNMEAVAMEARERAYLLRPETVESYLYLWRNTHDPKYRQWAWDVVQALEKHCKVEAGYSGIKDVSTVGGEKDDVQQSYFLAETLKYLYLIFSEDDLLPFDRWVFNTEAHPFPIRGRVRLPFWK